MLCDKEDSEDYLVLLGGLNFFLDSLSHSWSYILQYRYHCIYLILGLSQAVLSPPSSLPDGIALFLKIDDLSAELDTAFPKCLPWMQEKQVFQQELLSMKLMQKKCEFQRGEKEVGARSSEPQKSYRYQYNRTQSS